MTSSAQRRIAVIGGGISGLAAAHRLRELLPSAQVTLFEASDHLGGVLQTVERNGYLIERSADMFTTREPWALDLCQRIGLADELINTDPRYRRAFIVHHGRLVPVPEGFTLMSPAKVWPVLRTPLLSPLGKLRLAWEYFVPGKKDDADESLSSFALRRFGREAFERLIQPLIGGIYTADPDLLSMQATLQQFVQFEKKHGSLIRAVRTTPTKAKGKSKESGARYGQFLAPKLGMSQLVNAIAARLPPGSIQLNTRVERIERTTTDAAANWCLFLAGSPAPLVFDDLIIAAPAYACPPLLERISPQLAGLVKSIPHAGCSVVVLGYPREQIKHPLDGFGFVAPRVERRKIIAGSMASVKFDGRAPDGRVLFRVFVGGALQPELNELDDAGLERLVRGELRELIGVSGEPDFCQINRWLGVMPQYHVGHLELVAKIDTLAESIEHFALAGNAYHGVGVPFCVRSGELAAERIASVER
ncbi:protoporphyrinogen oxidase [Anatilimnocola floriformis]|uniref:protoporphyrinogen oxidase n=1 Tax=Anatilimnocola floriformis TaxID=2948575 RepID=UPI0020C2705A|nr:protoporphyrinogen oxidase [Anatilimnocola floriformis]